MAFSSRLCLVLCLSIAGCGPNPQAKTPESPKSPGRSSLPTASPSEPVRVRFHNVHLRIAPGAVLEVRDLEGALLATTPGQPPVFDDERSFDVRVDAGTVAISPASLTRLLNDRVFAAKDSSIRNARVTIEGGRLRQDGTLKKGLRIPFSIVAEIAATADGRIRVHPTKVKAAGIRAAGLMKLFGIEMDDLVKSNPSAGLEIVDNDLLLAPDRLLPSPTLRGRLRAVRIEGDRIVQVYGGDVAPLPRNERGNFMHYRGGTLRFGKLTMSDTDMRLIDADPRDPFDFSPEGYQRQLVAGYSKNTPEGGLRVYMPDYDQAAKGSGIEPPPLGHGERAEDGKAKVD